MPAFDRYTERCPECDGHWHHYHPCSSLNCEWLPGRGFSDRDPECAKLGRDQSHGHRDSGQCECAECVHGACPF